MRFAKHPNGALHTSPGQRPGNIARYTPRRSEGTPHIYEWQTGGLSQWSLSAHNSLGLLPDAAFLQNA